MKNLLELSPKALSLLESVLYHQVVCFDEPLGFYCEHDNVECKPFNTNVVFELCASGLVNLSYNNRVFVQHGKKVCGVEFLTIVDLYFDLLKEHFGFNQE
jgi:hypothetical protein